MEEIRYFHGSTPDGYIFTLAGKIMPNDKILLGISLCSDRDNFNKKIGRQISSGRLGRLMKYETKEVRGVISVTGKNKEDFFKKALEFTTKCRPELLKIFSLYKKN